MKRFFAIIGVTICILCCSVSVALADPELFWIESPDDDCRVVAPVPNSYGDGLYIVEVQKGDTNYTAHAPEGAGSFYYGYVNQQGEWILPPSYFSAKPFVNGYAEVGVELSEMKNGGWYFWNEQQIINLNGTKVTGTELVKTEEESTLSTLIAVEQDGKWGFCDADENMVVPYLYDEVKPFSEGIAAVCIDNLWGCINQRGDVVLPCKYDAVGPCKENRIAVKWQNRYGYYNALGEREIDFLYGAVTDFCNGYAVVSSGDFTGCTWNSYWKIGSGISQSYNNNMFGLIDLWGNAVTNEAYIYISDVHDGTAICQRADDNRIGIMQLSKTQKQEPAKQTVSVTLPGFDVTLNGTVIDNTNSQYPLIVYKDITYVPMTYYDCRFLGLETIWSQEDGLSIVKTDVTGAYHAYPAAKPNRTQDSAMIAPGKIAVNGKTIDNRQETYPLLLYRDVTYFPLTWRFAVDAFGWEYHFSPADGLSIQSSNTQSDTVSIDDMYSQSDITIDTEYLYYQGFTEKGSVIYRRPLDAMTEDTQQQEILELMYDEDVLALTDHPGYTIAQLDTQANKLQIRYDDTLYYNIDVKSHVYHKFDHWSETFDDFGTFQIYTDAISPEPVTKLIRCTPAKTEIGEDKMQYVLNTADTLPYDAWDNLLYVMGCKVSDSGVVQIDLNGRYNLYAIDLSKRTIYQVLEERIDGYAYEKGIIYYWQNVIDLYAYHLDTGESQYIARIPGMGKKITTAENGVYFFTDRYDQPEWGDALHFWDKETGEIRTICEGYAVGRVFNENGYIVVQYAEWSKNPYRLLVFDKNCKQVYTSADEADKIVINADGVMLYRLEGTNQLVKVTL